MGYDWHPDCLKCEECGKILKPGQHSDHKGVPYCHVPCYGALFGPQLFGHGTRVESHKSFGKVENKSYGGITRSQLDTTLKTFNNYQEVHGGSGGVKSREVNGRLILEGVLKLYWGIHSSIQLKEDDDQRLPCSTSTLKSQRKTVSNGSEFHNVNIASEDSESEDELRPDDVPKNGTTKTSLIKSKTNSGYEVKPYFMENCEASKYKTVPSKLEPKQLQRDELDDLLQVERQWKDHEKPYQTLPNHVGSNTQVLEKVGDTSVEDATVDERAQPVKCTALRRRPGRRFDKSKLKRRCSINGHYYNRETSVFTPPHGSTMSVWTTSLVSTQEVVNMLLDKYRVECPASNFCLFIIKDNGERRRVRDEEYPLLLRVTLGPDESVAKLFLVEREGEDSHEVSAAVAQFIHLSDFECNSILRLFCEEEEREVQQIKNKHRELKRRIKKRMQDLKVKL